MSNTMRVYVGTYNKYNCGNLFGAWLDLSDYSDKEEFYNACKELHSTEADPEFMFQDFEGIPDGMISESHIDDEVFELAQEDEDDLEVFYFYRSDVDQHGTIEESKEAYRGHYSSKEDYAQEFYEESGQLEGVPAHIVQYIDWESVARDMEYSQTSFVRANGGYHVFEG